MAALLKEDLIKILTTAGVALRGDELKDELLEIAEAHKLVVDGAGVPSGDGPAADSSTETQTSVTEPAEAATAIAKKGAHTRTVFHLHNIVVKTREFSEAEHGENWQDIVEEFAKSNAKKIRSREDL